MVELMRVRDFWMEAAQHLAKADHRLSDRQVMDQCQCAELSDFILAAYRKQASKEYSKTGILALLWRGYRRERRDTGPAEEIDFEPVLNLFAEK